MNNTNINTFISEVSSFLNSTSPQEKSKSLKAIENLFCHSIDSQHEKEAINLLKEKVFNNLTTKELIESSDENIRDSISLIIKKAPNELGSFHFDHNQLSVEDFQDLKVIKSKTNSEEKLQAIKNLSERHNKPPYLISFKETYLSSLIIESRDPLLMKELLSNKELVEQMKTGTNFEINFFFSNCDDKESLKFFLDHCKGNNVPLDSFGGPSFINLFLHHTQLPIEDILEILEKAMECIFIKSHVNNYLCTAIDKQKREIINFFLDKEDVDKPDGNGLVPVYEAITKNDHQTLEELLKRKAFSTPQSQNRKFKGKTLIDHVLEKEDVESGRLLNKYVPKIINPLLATEDLNSISVLKTSREESYKNKVKVYKQFESLKNQSDMEIKIKHLSHSFSIKGETPIISEEGNKLLRLEGSISSYKIFKNLSNTTENSLQMLNIDLENGPLEALMFSSTAPSAQQLKENFDEGKWTVVFTGFEKHGVTVLLKKGDKEGEPAKFIICNRGAAMTTPVDCFSFPAEKLTVEEIQSLLDVQSKQRKDYTDLLFKTLPNKLGLKKGKEDILLDKKCLLEIQTVGNCGYASPEMALKTMILKNTIDKKVPKGLLGDWKLVDQVISEVSNDFEATRSLNRLKNLRDYLKLFDKEGFEYKLTPFLVGKSLALLWSSGSVDNPIVEKELHEVENHFLELMRKTHQEEFIVDYKTQKLFQKAYESSLKIENVEAKKLLGTILEAYDKLFLSYSFGEGNKDPKVLQQMEKDFSKLLGDISWVLKTGIFIPSRLGMVHTEFKRLISTYEHK